MCKSANYSTDEIKKDCDITKYYTSTTYAEATKMVNIVILQ